MRAKLAAFCVSILASAGVCAAQTPAGTPNPNGQVDYSKVYCSGFRERPKGSRRYSSYFGRTVELQDYFLARRLCICEPRAQQGVKLGDVFSIVRPDKDPTNEWFYGQEKATKRMGIVYRDLGQIRDRQRSGGDFHRRSSLFVRLHAARRRGAAVCRAPSASV